MWTGPGHLTSVTSVSEVQYPERVPGKTEGEEVKAPRVSTQVYDISTQNQLNK